MPLSKLRHGFLLFPRFGTDPGDWPNVLILGFSSQDAQRAHQPPAWFDREGVPPCHHEAAQLPVTLGGTALSE